LLRRYRVLQVRPKLWKPLKRCSIIPQETRQRGGVDLTCFRVDRTLGSNLQNSVLCIAQCAQTLCCRFCKFRAGIVRHKLRGLFKLRNAQRCCVAAAAKDTTRQNFRWNALRACPASCAHIACKGAGENVV